MKDSPLFFSPEHNALRAQVARFVRERLAPHVDAWEDAGEFPREVYREAAAAGALGVGFPEEFGGSGGDALHGVVIAEELTRSGSPGLAASLGSLSIALPPIVLAGSDAQKRRWLPPVLQGEWIAALAVTEPGTGSDVAGVTTRAVRDGSGWKLNGQKTFITSGTRADLLVVLARTGGPGASGLSFFGVEASVAGVTRGRPLSKMGWHASDTAEIFFEDVRLADDALIGGENQGFLVAMQNFAAERLMLAVTAVEIAQLAFEASRSYVRERQAFGKPIVAFQVTRHKLAEMATAIASARALNYVVASRLAAGENVIAEVAQAKNRATDVCSEVVDAAVQLHGGAGFMRGTLVERLYRDARLYPIGGGTREIMNEIITKAMAF